jgi:hypothetical protein
MRGFAMSLYDAAVRLKGRPTRRRFRADDGPSFPNPLWKGCRPCVQMKRNWDTLEKMAEPGTQAGGLWCGRINTELQDDHVFPRSIGGTKELCVPSCGSCQTSISKAEKELSRNSAYAMHLLEAGPRGRRSRKDPASGFIEAQYVLVPHPLGGYNETALKAGAGESPTALPYIEIEVANGSFLCRRRASVPSEIDKLMATFERLHECKPDQDGLVAEVDVLTHDLGEIGNDPDFWPRIVLDLKGRLFIRARSPEESGQISTRFRAGFKSGCLQGSFWLGYRPSYSRQHPTYCNGLLR